MDREKALKINTCGSMVYCNQKKSKENVGPVLAEDRDTRRPDFNVKRTKLTQDLLMATAKN